MTDEIPAYALRLQEFVNSLGLASTQVADIIRIPRPSFSQLLSGRNKTIGSATLELIHAAYPELNMAWLLFGEGNMLLSPNFKTSERQNEASGHDFSEQSTEIKLTNATQPSLAEMQQHSPVREVNEYNVSYMASACPVQPTRILVVFSDGSTATFIPEKKCDD